MLTLVDSTPDWAGVLTGNMVGVNPAGCSTQTIVCDIDRRIPIALYLEYTLQS